MDNAICCEQWLVLIINYVFELLNYTVFSHNSFIFGSCNQIYQCKEDDDDHVDFDKIINHYSPVAE